MLTRIFPPSNRLHCPDEHQLAAYVDQQLIGAERERVESHLARCDSCLQQVGFLIKESQVSAVFAPSSLVHRAKKLATGVRQDAPFGWRSVSVAAASALVVIALLAWREDRKNVEHHPTIIAIAKPPVPIIRDDTKSAAEAVRSSSQPDSTPVVVIPQPGATVRASDFTIRWEAVPNVAAYEVRIVTAEGDILWRRRLQENSVNPPKEILQPGLKYFVWVRALLANGKTQQSHAVGFTGG